MTDDLIIKLQKKINYNLKVIPIYKDSESEKLLKIFLEKQVFLKPKKYYQYSKLII